MFGARQNRRLLEYRHRLPAEKMALHFALTPGLPHSTSASHGQYAPNRM
jgi:hypothetical protein